MQVICQNCKTVHKIADSYTNEDDNLVIKCTNCRKNIKFQNCPHCDAFYSITFSEIKPGNYVYKCKRCFNNFTIKFSDNEKIVQKEKKIYDDQQNRLAEKNKNKIIDENKLQDKPQYKDAETFSISELFKFVSEAFTIKKIFVSAIGIAFMLIFLQIFNSVMNFAAISATNSRTIIASSVINVFPIAIIFSFYILSASIVSKITLNRTLYSRETKLREIIRFTMKKGFGIIGANIILLSAISLLLVLFGNIPLLRPIFFSLAFLPVYLLSVVVLILSFIGFWFYPSIVAHDERGVLKSIKGLLLFVKRHKLSVIFMILVIFLITIVTSAVIFFVHISVFSFTTSISELFIGQDVLMTLSSIPSQLIKTSQTVLTGINSGVFKGLYQSLEVTHYVAGFIFGIILLLMTIFILSISVSVAATVSTHIYLFMERQNSINDKTKALALAILIMLIILMLLIKKMM